MNPLSVILAYVDLLFKRQCPGAEVSPVEVSPFQLSTIFLSTIIVMYITPCVFKNELALVYIIIELLLIC